MQYALLIYIPDATDENRHLVEATGDDPAWGAYTAALIAAGAMRGGSELTPAASATTVRQRAGHREVQDGPFADTKERLGGFYLIDVPDLDTALDWAARCPAAAFGSIEVRAVAGA